MAVIPEDTLSEPMVLVGAPPPTPKRPDPPQESLTDYWYASQGVLSINDDSCQKIYDRGVKEDVLLKYLVRTVNLNEPNNLQSSMWAGNQAGVANQPEKVDRLDSGVLIYSSAELISGPYFAVQREYYRNGVDGCGRNEGQGKIVYKWKQTSPGRLKIFPEEKGQVKVIPAGRDKMAPISVMLPVVFQEANDTELAPGKNTQVNAFSLVLGIEPGNAAKVAVPPQNGPVSNVQETQRWKVEIRFGEITATVMENRSEVRIRLGGNNEERVIAIEPSPASKTNTSTSDQPYLLTFIPVWNGILVSDAPPGSPNFKDRVTYILKDSKVNLYDVIQNILKAHQQAQPPRYGPGGINLPRFDPSVGNPGPAIQITDQPHPGAVGATSVPPVDFGQDIKVDFYRCGGILQFQPVYFTQQTRTHLLLRGEQPSSPLDNSQIIFVGGVPVLVSSGTQLVLNGPQGPIQQPLPPKDCTTFQTVFDTKISPVIGSLVVPVVYYNAGDTFKARIGFFKLIQSANPIWVIAQEFTRQNPKFRRPLETWGCFVYSAVTTQNFLKNDDGVLRQEDVPQPRIRQCSIQRSLEGSSGSIVWDRYDPVLGLFYRPGQFVGAVRIVMMGGIDTIPDVVATMIGMGNSENDTHDNNTIEIPLHGKEVKMTDSEGGLRLINAPFFDGYEHSIVTQYLCDYAGVPYLNFSKPYKLPTGTLLAPVVDFKTGTPVWDAIQEENKLASTISFFDRFGFLREYDVGSTSGINWVYPDAIIESYQDKPDLTQMRDTVVVAGLVSVGDVDLATLFDHGQEANFQPMLVTLRAITTPFFPWSKMMFYAIPGIMKPGELFWAAAKIIFGVTRPRAAAQVTIPGNGSIELLDTFNSGWVVTGITQTCDTQSKTWRTNLNLELLVGVAPDGSPPPPDKSAGQPPPGGPEKPPPPSHESPGSSMSMLTQLGTDPQSDAGINTTPPAEPNPPNAS